MASQYLHMDPLIDFTQMMEGYGWITNLGGEFGRDKKIGTCKSEILCRIFVIVQTTFIMVFGTVRQTVRAITFTVTGILTLNWQHLKFAMKDYLSIVVNLLVLPILGIVAIFSPGAACQLASKVIGKTNHMKFYRVTDHDQTSHLVEPRTYIMHPLPTGHCFVAKVILCLTGTIQGVTAVVQGFLRAIFTFEIGCTSLVFPLALIIVFIAPLVSYEAKDTSAKEMGWIHAAKVHGFYHVV